MPKLSAITPTLTVRQVATACPVCADLLSRFPDARLDGRWNLQELAPFAAAHGLAPCVLLDELAAAAGVPVDDSPPRREPSPAPLILVALSIALTLGAGWGVLLLLSIAWGADYASVSGAAVHIHGVAQLWGWMAVFVFAVGAHLLRQNTPRPAPELLERIATVAVLAAILAFFAGLLPAVHRGLPLLTVLASALLALAAVLFSLSVLWSLLGRRAKPLLWHLFVFAMVAWLIAWAATDLTLRIRYLHAPVLPDSARDLLIALPVFGFAINAIYGFGIRLLPGLLNLARLQPRFFAAALTLHNLGLLLVLFTTSWPAAIGAALMLLAAGTYLLGMGLLRSKPSRPLYGVDLRGGILIRVAFFWLVAGLAMVFVQYLLPPLPHPYAGAWRHALTVGFITTMILGVGHRMIPIFVKQLLASTRLMLVAAALIILGNALRVSLELATLGGAAWTFRIMGVSGLLELTAIGLFAFNILLTLRRRSHVYAAGEPLRPDTRVRQAINARPDLQVTLHNAGVTMLDQAGFVAPSLTFGAMALAWGLSPEELLARLESPPGHPG